MNPCIIFLIASIMFALTNGLQYVQYKPTKLNQYDPDDNYFIQSRGNDIKHSQPRSIRRISSESMPNIPLPLYFLSQEKKSNRKTNQKKKAQESSIFYIRLPPTPYMMVPGLGYVSQPPNITPLLGPAVPQIIPQVSHEVKPMNFKESFMTVDSYGHYMDSKKKKTNEKKKLWKNSKIERLNGLFYFNGRPENVFTLPMAETK